MAFTPLRAFLGFINIFYYDFIIKQNALASRNDHTTVTAPLPVCSAKLSTVGPG